MNTTISILGNDFKLSTLIVEKIILNTKARTDQEHIKMNIVINNKLLEKDEDELKDIIDKITSIHSDYLLLTFNDNRVYEIIERNLNIPIINKTINQIDDNYIKKIINICGKEYV